jgi:hypothetical protein
MRAGAPAALRLPPPPIRRTALLMTMLRSTAEGGARSWGVRAAAAPILLVTIAFVAAKVAVLGTACVLFGAPQDFVTRLSLNLDGGHYLALAQSGYGASHLSADLAFPPFFPFVIRLAGAGPLSPLLVSNIAGVLAVAWITHLMGWRAGLFFALFPTWMAYSSFGYSESLFVLLAVVSFWLCRRTHMPLLAGAAAAAAGLTRYAGGIALLAASLPEAWSRPARAAAYAAPILLAGAVALSWQFALTGDPLAYLAAERHWGVRFAWPWQVARWYLHGWFGVRNYAFEMLSAVGTWLLFRGRRYADGVFSLVLIMIALSVTGTPVLSAPRLLLGAFPATAVLGDRVSGWGSWLGYAALALAGAVYIVLGQLTFFFA